MDTIKNKIGEIKKDFNTRLDARLPGTTMTKIAQNMRKEADLNRKVEDMNTRLTKGEKDSIISVSLGESTSEGEKVLNIQVSKVMVPEIAFTKPPAFDSIDLIKIAAAKLESNDKLKKFHVAAVELKLNEKRKKLDKNIKNKFGPIGKQYKVFSHFSQMRQISANEMSLGNLERGQPSTIKPPKANVIFQPKRNYPKNLDKNLLDLMYATPKPDEKKLLGRSIAFFKDPRDSVINKRIAKNYRNAKNLAKKPATTEAALPVMAFENLTEGKQEKPKQTKRRFRYKLLAKRKLDLNEDKEEYMPTQSTTSSQSAIPTLEEAEFKVDPNITFHGEPVIPKDEPIDWDSLSLPDLNIPIYAKPRKTKKRVVRMVKDVKLQSKSMAKPKPIVNKGDQLFICDIKEFSNNKYVFISNNMGGHSIERCHKLHGYPSTKRDGKSSTSFSRSKTNEQSCALAHLSTPIGPPTIRGQAMNVNLPRLSTEHLDCLA
ncbi:hypothetical protein AgCh_021280 [Apium graveolens]